MLHVHMPDRAQAALKNCLQAALDLIAPPRCLVCHEPVREVASLCPACWRRLVLIEEPCCDRSGMPFPFDQGEGAISAAALADPPAWDRARAATVFNETSRGLIHSLKYRDHHEAALLMSRLMLRAAKPLLEGADAIVPVPLHRMRLWSRRYNQSGLLAQRIAAASGVRYRPEVLVRNRHTKRQVGLDLDARRKNVRRAFGVPDDVRPAMAGARIILVDDVLTTGATASAAVTTLRQAGAARADVLAFALVDAPKRLHI